MTVQGLEGQVLFDRRGMEMSDNDLGSMIDRVDDLVSAHFRTTFGSAVYSESLFLLGLRLLTAMFVNWYGAA